MTNAGKFSSTHQVPGHRKINKGLQPRDVSANSMKFKPMTLKELQKNKAQEAMEASDCSPVSNLIAVVAKLDYCIANKQNLIGGEATEKEMAEMMKQYISLNQTLLKYESHTALPVTNQPGTKLVPDMPEAEEDPNEDLQNVKEATVVEEEEYDASEPLDPKELMKCKMNTRKSLEDRV